MFISKIPNMLKAGNINGMVKNIFSGVFILRFGRENIEFLFIL
jgi:hypothetical protein